MPKYDWEDWEELEEEAFRDKITPKIKPKRKKKDYDDTTKKSTRINKKHPDRS
jgi:hypothetical protein|tara:strand:- start:143 stop:301 length:159 start_codon:yes stop_codon:yes gene_type:complete